MSTRPTNITHPTAGMCAEERYVGICFCSENPAGRNTEDMGTQADGRKVEAVLRLDEYAIASCLRDLTKAISQNGLGEHEQGILGGEWGYGAEYENDVFAMHPFCWCDSQHCPWCAGCECPDFAFQYFVDGQCVNEQEWLDFYDDALAGGSTPAEINARRAEHHEPICVYCKGEFGNAPNFIHKPSGNKIWWYKYIGRGMKLEGNTPWVTVLEECFQSIGGQGELDADAKTLAR